MSTINRHIAASIEGDFVVFIIGARFNRWWKLPKYLWFLSTMPKMLAEVAARPGSGFLGWEALSLTTNMEYWRSLEHLTAYCRDSCIHAAAQLVTALPEGRVELRLLDRHRCVSFIESGEER